MPDRRPILLPALSPTAWDRLGTRLGGTLVRPGDPAYDLAKRLQYTHYDVIKPAGIAYCENVMDIRACLDFAAHNGIPAHVRSGGHSMGGWSTGDGLVIDVSRINHVSVAGSLVRIGAGTRSVDDLHALQPLDRQMVTGTSPNVSAAGFLSGGGIGWQTRKFGMACDRIAAAAMVLADGTLVRCSSTVEPDLYWAVRGGGGGNFGILVAFEIRPIDAPSLTAFETTWHIDDAVGVLVAWQAWSVAAPAELGSTLLLLPPFGPDGQAIVKILGAFHGPRDELSVHLNELTAAAGARPLTSTVYDQRSYTDGMHGLMCAGLTVAQCQRTGDDPHAKVPRNPFTVQTCRLVDNAFDTATAAKLVAVWEQGTGRERCLQCTATGGAANTVGRADTAYAHRDARFLLGFQAVSRDPAPSADDIAELTAWTDNADAVLAPLASGCYINFPNTKPPADWGTAYYGENYQRLLDVKRKYDPTGFFRHAGSLRPMGG